MSNRMSHLVLRIKQSKSNKKTTITMTLTWMTTLTTTWEKVRLKCCKIKNERGQIQRNLRLRHLIIKKQMRIGTMMISISKMTST